MNRKNIFEVILCVVCLLIFVFSNFSQKVSSGEIKYTFSTMIMKKEGFTEVGQSGQLFYSCIIHFTLILFGY